MRCLCMRAAIPNTALLRIAVDTHAPSVYADPIAMQRVLLNLVLNAARAIRQPHGAIEIGVAGMTGSDARHGAEFVRLTVADNGVGMDGSTVSDLRQNITETTDMASGAGLGLRMVHQAVSPMAGRLQFDSQPGSGTTVRIDLPALVQQ